ncbi:DUF2721 domain-containing protein [Novilysobacter arseniciresistens]|uniref:DUF2721 domain-containing protein n=1 Tax=Novilysobacter arseniciresistens TaxID=1385522 RepID=UPI000ABD0499|nr:DUF2721 domain-containing protein [Lysobacter arseniciresistens]
MIPTDSQYAVLTAMLAPAFFLTATGSLLISASNRLARVVDRLRQLMKEMEQTTDPDELQWLDHRVTRQRRRSGLILRANQMLYLSLSFFVATSLMVVLEAFVPSPAGLLPTTFAILGVLGLFASSLLLSRESTIALAILNEEMDRSHTRARAGGAL